MLITKHIDFVLQKGNFHIKGWTLSGCVEDAKEKLLIPEEWEKVLSLLWIPSTDQFMFNVKINFSKKYKGVHAEPDITPQNMSNKLPNVLTERMILSQVLGIFDPLGLISPFVIKAKIYLRKLWALEPKLDWDDNLPQALYSEWAEFF